MLQTDVVLGLVVLTILFIIYYLFYGQKKKCGFKERYQDRYGDKHIADEKLIKAHKKLKLLIDHLNQKYAKTEVPEIKTGLDRINKNYKYENMKEQYPEKNNPDTSYVINKGEVFALCLRDKQTPSTFHEDNLITFVSIHELAHIFSVGYGHDTEFWTNFKFLLKEAREIGLYQFEDYKKNNRMYCGLNIEYTPLTDHSLSDIA